MMKKLLWLLFSISSSLAYAGGGDSATSSEEDHVHCSNCTQGGSVMGPTSRANLALLSKTHDVVKTALQKIKKERQHKKDTFENLKKRANKGDAQAQFELSNAYYKGRITKRNIAEAFLWLETSAINGCREAAYVISLDYQDGNCGRDIDLDQSLSWLKKACDAGDDPTQDLAYPKALYDLSHHYEDQNEAEKAFTLMKRSAELGHPSAQFDLGHKYHIGRGTAKNIPEALKWSLLAFENGQIYAAHNIAIIYYERYEFQKAWDYWQKTLENQDSLSTNAHCFIGHCYRLGRGPGQNYKKALYHYTESLRLDDRNSYAHQGIGMLYFYGHGVKKNIAKAVFHFAKAENVLTPDMLTTIWNFYNTKKSKKIPAHAKVFLGHCYRLGLNTPQNHEKAYALYRATLKANYNCYHAHFGLGVMSLFGDHVKLDVNKAKYHFNMSCGAGDVNSCADLATAFKHKDFYRNLNYLELGAEAGHEGCLLDYAAYLYNQKNPPLTKISSYYEQAILHFQSAEAYFYLGAMHGLGTVPTGKSIYKAIQHYQQAFASGYFTALSQQLETLNPETDKDLIDNIKNRLRLCRNLGPLLTENIGNYYLNPDQSELTEQDIFEHYLHHTEHDCPHVAVWAKDYIHECYAYGIGGVQQDLEKAQQYKD